MGESFSLLVLKIWEFNPLVLIFIGAVTIKGIELTEWIDGTW
jgi:hypothetical protein